MAHVLISSSADTVICRCQIVIQGWMVVVSCKQFHQICELDHFYLLDSCHECELGKIGMEGCWDSYESLQVKSLFIPEVHSIEKPLSLFSFCMTSLTLSLNSRGQKSNSGPDRWVRRFDMVQNYERRWNVPVWRASTSIEVRPLFGLTKWCLSYLMNVAHWHAVPRATDSGWRGRTMQS